MVNMPYHDERKQADRLLANMRFAFDLVDDRDKIARMELGELINLVTGLARDFHKFDLHNREGYALPTDWTIRAEK